MEYRTSACVHRMHSGIRGDRKAGEHYDGREKGLFVEGRGNSRCRVA